MHVYILQVLRRELVHALQKKRPEIPVENFILHMDNASSHTAEKTQNEIGLIGFETLSHPPYSPDLAPFDFAFFPTIKNKLKGRRFHSLMDLRQATAAVVSEYDTEWYGQVFQKWVHRHRRCIECKGEYFEKC